LSLRHGQQLEDLIPIGLAVHKLADEAAVFSAKIWYVPIIMIVTMPMLMRFIWHTSLCRARTGDYVVRRSRGRR